MMGRGPRRYNVPVHSRRAIPVSIGLDCLLSLCEVGHFNRRFRDIPTGAYKSFLQLMHR
jgi:hypothetical protein